MNIHDLNRRVQPDHNPYQHKSGSDVAKPVQEKVDLFELALEENAEQRNQALRFNQGKLHWAMIDFKSLEGMVRVLGMGARKYSKDNWKLGMPVTEVCESLMRHLFAFMSGEDKDPESGESHMSHVLVNAMFVEFILREREHFDDRKQVF